MNAKGGPPVAYTALRVASFAIAIPLTTDKSVIEANALMATALASQIKLVGDLIRTYDERIESLFDTLPDAGLFKSLPGMGHVWAHGCLQHWGITVTGLTALKKFKTTRVLHR